MNMSWSHSLDRSHSCIFPRPNSKSAFRASRLIAVSHTPNSHQQILTNAREWPKMPSHTRALKRVTHAKPADRRPTPLGHADGNGEIRRHGQGRHLPPDTDRPRPSG